MGNKKTSEHKIFLGLGIITVICGIAGIFMQNYIVGIFGSIVGLFLTWDNYKKLTGKESRE